MLNPGDRVFYDGWAGEKVYGTVTSLQPDPGGQGTAHIMVWAVWEPGESTGWMPYASLTKVGPPVRKGLTAFLEDKCSTM